MANRIPKIYVASLLKDGALIPYEEALQIQQQAWELALKEGCGFLFLLEHPPVITYGKRICHPDPERSEGEGSLLSFPSYQPDRGGETANDGPGEIVGD